MASAGASWPSRRGKCARTSKSGWGGAIREECRRPPSPACPSSASPTEGPNLAQSSVRFSRGGGIKQAGSDDRPREVHRDNPDAAKGIEPSLVKLTSELRPTRRYATGRRLKAIGRYSRPR